MTRYLILFAVVSFLSACYYDNKSELYPNLGNSGCDTVNVTYTKNMVPIFLSNCGTNNSCHSASLAEGGIILDNYANASLVDGQLLLGSVEHAPGFIMMPPTGKLNDCYIEQIRIWVHNGKPQ